MYSMTLSIIKNELRVLFKKMEFVYVVFDEAHMLKNMASQRYEQLMKVYFSSIFFYLTYFIRSS